MIQELAPELMEIILGVILADSGDTATLRACSLAFSQHTTLFQRALCSRKPLSLPFIRDTDKDSKVQKMINTLVNLLDVNPRFGTCLGPDVRFYFGTSPQFLSDSRAAKIARCCSGTDSGIVSLTIDNLGGRGSWDDLSEENREALDGVIVHSPRLHTLNLVSMGLPWSVFLRPRPFLESLVVEHANTFTPILPWSVPLPAAKPNAVGFKPIRIGCMTAGPEDLRRLAEALSDTPGVDGKDAPSFAIDFGHLRGLVAICGYHGLTGDLRHVLHRANRLEELTLRTITSDIFLKGLFDKPHSAYFFHLRHLKFAQTSGYTDPNFLSALVSVLSHLPPTNVLETLRVEVLDSHSRGYPFGELVVNRKEMMVFLEHLTRCRFPSLKKVTVVINLLAYTPDTRIHQLTEQKEEFEGMKWDFGSLLIDLRGP